MKAIVYHNYGSPDVLHYEEIEKPIAADNEVLVEVRAASINALDKAAMRAPLFIRPMIGGGMRAPRHTVLGADIAGRVEAVGKLVTQFKPGDEVFGTTELFGKKRLGGFAEYTCALADKLALKPSNASFEAAASLPIAAVTALQGLRNKGQIRPGQKVLIDGASGGVGTFAVQIAKSFGAEVTAVCSTRNVETARSIGADHVIDYTREDFARSGLRYDLILAANAHHSIFEYRRALTHRGIFVMAGGGIAQMLQGLLLAPMLSLVGSRKMCSFLAKMNSEDMAFLANLLETGKVVPVIDRVYPLCEVAEAMRYLEEVHAQGKVVITIGQPL
jgi:NADPH:quinone reductase-like Zn-dependent oxidoreductase